MLATSALEHGVASGGGYRASRTSAQLAAVMLGVFNARCVRSSDGLTC